MAFTSEQITLGLTTVTVIVVVAGYYGNKYGKAQLARDTQTRKDADQDTRLTTVENALKGVWKQMDQHSESIVEFRKSRTEIKLLQNSFEAFSKQFLEVKSDIKEIFKLLLEDRKD